jgi:hypothetical protein
MATDDSFNATGPTVVAFETLSTSAPVNQTFGVSVVGDRCGVYGQQATTQRDRRIAPVGAGVLGRGEGYGVYGISFTISESNTPDYGRFAGIGVFGVSDSVGSFGTGRSDFPAILGNNFILEADAQANPLFTVISEARGLPVGVEGVSWHGHGVYGVSLTLDPAKPPGPVSAAVGGVAATAAGVNPDPTFVPPLATPTAPAGVMGLSVFGPGVRGASRTDRGGVFESSTTRPPGSPAAAVAQIRLVPQDVPTTAAGATVVPSLPIRGQTGDLLVAVYPQVPSRPVNTAHLWFCERGFDGSAPAVWREMVLGSSLLGTV